MIWAFVNLKGGVGKSTLCVNIAAALTHGRRRALVLDLDPQRSATAWFARRQGLLPERRPIAFKVELMPTLHSIQSIRERARDPDYLLLDTPAFDERTAIIALEVADFAVVPLEASQSSLEGTVRTLSLVTGKGVPFKIVLNRVQPNVRIGRDIFERINRQWRGHVARYIVHQRVEFANADLVGRAVLESEPNGLASREILAVTQVLRRAI
jgi:chromosome partitioning protein